MQPAASAEGEDMAEALYHAVGLDLYKEYVTPTCRPIRLANDGTVVRERFKSR